MTFMNAIYGRIKTFRWKGLVWLIIEDEGVYEMVADEKGYLKQNECAICSINVHTYPIDGALVGGLHGSE